MVPTDRRRDPRQDPAAPFPPSRPVPEVHLRIRWPDGRATPLYSPSTVILETLPPGRQLTVAELRRLGREALRQASERVRQRYGFACTRADEEERRLLQTADGFDPAEEVSILEG